MSLPTREELYREAMVVRAKKWLGQNFLVEPMILKAIVDSLDLKPGETVLEIGPGLGFLTRFLCESGAKVFAVELDRDLGSRLEAKQYPNLTVIHGDFLDFDLNSLAVDSLKVVGNVPYQITSPIIAHVLGELDEPSPWLARVERLTMTVQLEVARRICAGPGSKEFGLLTILADYFTEPKFLLKVGKEHFVPRPDVESAVVQLARRPSPKVEVHNCQLLKRVVAGGFKERRKMLRNNLAFTKLSPEEVGKILLSLGISPSARAECLSLSDFARLTDALTQSVP